MWPAQYCNNYQVWPGEIFQQHAQLLSAGPPILGLHQHPTGQLHAVCEYQTSLASSSLTTSSTRWRRRGSQHSGLSTGLSSGQWCFDSCKIRGKKQSEDYLYIVKKEMIFIKTSLVKGGLYPLHPLRGQRGRLGLGPGGRQLHLLLLYGAEGHWEVRVPPTCPLHPACWWGDLGVPQDNGRGCHRDVRKQITMVSVLSDFWFVCC